MRYRCPIAVFLVFIVAVFILGSGTSLAKSKPNTTKRWAAPPAIVYGLYDMQREKHLGALTTSKSIVAGDILFLDDDCYLVKIVKIFSNEDGYKHPQFKSYEEEHIELWISFVGKKTDLKSND